MSNNLEEQRMINTDPREYGYHQSYSPQESAFRQRTHRGTARALVLVLIFLAMLGTGLIFWGLSGPSQTATLPVHSFHVAGHTRLIVNNTSGEIHIHAGSADSIVVQAREYAHGFGASTNDVTVNYQQQGDTVSITSDESWNFLSERDVNFDISVPNTTDLQIKNTAGDIAIEHVSGNIEAQDVSGDIKASDLQGTLGLSTHSGDVTLDGANGTMTLSAISGDVQAHHIQLHGQSSMTSTSGDITFEGSLDPNGSYRMGAVSGDVNLTLPSDAAFKLDASTTSGDVHNDFGDTTVGSVPQPALTLHTTSGDINIKKQ